MDLNDYKRTKLTKLWFVFGNGGSKHTKGNHKFIQRFLDRDPPQDMRDFYKPTQECMDNVDEILGNE